MTQNLLFMQDEQNLNTGYKYRKIIVWGIVLSFTFLISAVVFLPVLFITKSKMDGIVQNQVISELALNEQKNFLDMPSQINHKSEIALSFKSTSDVSNKISKIQGALVTGVSLESISLDTKVSSDNSHTILVSGTALNRATLLSFEKALKQIDFVKSTSIPVSSFARDINLPFTINISINSSPQ